MIDIHCHILPGLDDGSPDWEQSLEMACLAVADGIREIVCTPHWAPGIHANTRAPVLDLVAAFREKLAENDIPLEVRPGAELRLDPDLPKKIRSGELLSINDTGRFILVELPELFPPNLDEFFHLLIRQDIIPVICHPERNHQVKRNLSLLYGFVEAGCLAQVTAGSITGVFGSEVQKFSLLLLEHGLAHVIATDAHDLGRRAPVLSEALLEIEGLLGEEAAENMVTGTPRRILNGEVVIAPAPIPITVAPAPVSFSRKIFSFLGFGRQHDAEPSFNR
jgi:protein-tyrosine phosphatase